MIPEFAVLGQLMQDLHGSITQLYYMALPVAILLAIVIGFLKSGSPDYIDTLKRVVVACILLIAFPEISNAIVNICDGIAQRIDDMSGLDTFLKLAQQKSQSYTHASNVLLLKFDDLIIAILAFASFMIIYVARYLNIAMYYFFWVFLSVLSPIMILFYIFPKTSYITANLFKSLIQVASWKIAWALLSAMLKSLALGNIYQTEGSYVTLIVLNFVIAIAMILTPMIVKSTIGEGTQAMAETLGAGAVASVVALPGRAAVAKDMIARPISRGYKTIQKANKEIKDFY